jgi:hypothetical protein
MRALRALLCTLPLLLAGPLAARQTPSDDAGLVRVYLDCSGCDSEYVRTEIAFVDFVRDRTAADVHLLITYQSTGASGRSYTLNFIGNRRFDGVNDTLSHVTSGDATADDIRRSLTRIIKLGLARFAAQSSAVDGLALEYQPPDSADANGAAPARDPWNFWVFSIRTSGFVDGESSRRNLFVNSGVSATRTTDQWKIQLELQADYNEGRTEIDDSTTVNSLIRGYSASASIVKSVGANLSAGLTANLATSTFGNQELVTRLAPAIEYNIFPYSESTRRQFTFSYSVGANSYDYREETIFGRTDELLGAHALTIAYTTRQPWGQSSIALSSSQFLHDAAKYRAVLSGQVSVRLFRGFSINGGGQYSHIRDQLSLPARGATPEEILLRQRQLATNYRYFFNIGVSYNFGSLFSPVVNPRLRNMLGGVEFF